MSFRWQIKSAIKKNPDHFSSLLNKHKIVFDPLRKDLQATLVDWSAELLIKQVDNIGSCLFNYPLIVAKEFYVSDKALLVGGKSEAEEIEKLSDTEKDLWAAQGIFKIFRDAFVHMKINDMGTRLEPRYENKQEKNCRVYEIKKLNICFDEKRLNGKKLEWSHIGGQLNFIRLIKFLEDDLKKRLSK